MVALLEVTDINLAFDAAIVLRDVSFSVESGECVGLIGPNGAGKSSILNCISRSYRYQAGSIRFDDQNLNRLKPHQVVKAGVMRTFQNVELSPHRSVVRNVMVGGHTNMKSNFLESLTGIGRIRADEARIERESRELLERLGLGQYADLEVSELPYGGRKLVEIARALLAKPKLLLLDEPVAGTNPYERMVIAEQIREIAGETGISTILVEHDVEFVRSLVDRLVVLDFGRVIATGEPNAVLSDPAVIEAYVGRPDE